MRPARSARGRSLDGSTADTSEAGGCDNDEEDFTDDTSIIGLIDNAFEFANKNATRGTCPLQLPWGKGCRTMGSGIPSRKGAVDNRGSRRRHETVAHFGHPRIGRPGFETCAHLGDTMLGKLTLAMRPRAPQHTKRAGHGFGAIKAKKYRGEGVTLVHPAKGVLNPSLFLSGTITFFV